MTLDNDILRPLSGDEIDKIIEICANGLPMSIRGFNFLHMVRKFEQSAMENPEEFDKMIVSDYLRRNIYTKRDGQLENCTFISISRPRDYNIYVYSNCDDELRECLMHTNLIDYALGPYFISFEGRHRQILADVFKTRNVKINVEVASTSCVLPRDVARELEYANEIANDVFVENLRLEDVDVIDAVWPHRYPGSPEYLKSLVCVNDSVGIFSKDTRQVRAWAMLNEQFGVGYKTGMVQTLEEYRGKGYAQIVIKALAKIVAQKYNLDVMAFIVHGNKVSEHTFTKLGFRQIPMPNDYSWVFTKS